MPVIGVESDRQGRSDCVENIRSGLEEDMGIPFTAVSANGREYRAELLSAIVKHAPTDFESPTLVGDIFSRGDAVVLVAPQDIQAPKGRLILPQVQVIRDILDNGGLALTVTFDCFPKLLDSRKNSRLCHNRPRSSRRSIRSHARDVPLTSFP